MLLTALISKAALRQTANFLQIRQVFSFIELDPFIRLWRLPSDEVSGHMMTVQLSITANGCSILPHPERSPD